MKLASRKGEVQGDLTRQLELMRAELEERGRLHREGWQIKRDACLAALRSILRIKQLPVETQEARDAMNRLILSCDNPEVVVLSSKPWV